MEEDTSQSQIVVTNSQLHSALEQALGYCKLNRYDYILSSQDLPKIQKYMEHALTKTRTTKEQTHAEIVAGLVGDFASTLVSDSFTECFKSPKRISYNFTPFLYVFYLVGVFIRWCILLPLRALWFMASIVVFSVLIMSV